MKFKEHKRSYCIRLRPKMMAVIEHLKAQRKCTKTQIIDAALMQYFDTCPELKRADPVPPDEWVPNER